MTSRSMESESSDVPDAGGGRERDGSERRGSPEEVVNEKFRGCRALNDEKGVSFSWVKLSEDDGLREEKEKEEESRSEKWFEETS